MSTHSALGVRLDDGTISGCYVHYDGDSMLPRIEDYVEKNTTTSLLLLIAEAQVAGGIRSFHCPPSFPIELPPVTELLDSNDLYAIDETNFYEDHMGTYAWYLVDYTTGTIEKRSRYDD